MSTIMFLQKQEVLVKDEYVNTLQLQVITIVFHNSTFKLTKLKVPIIA
jgi:hypothetical protein